MFESPSVNPQLIGVKVRQADSADLSSYMAPNGRVCPEIVDYISDAIAFCVKGSMCERYWYALLSSFVSCYWGGGVVSEKREKCD